MTESYRKLKLTKEQVKNFFSLKAIDFATDKEKKKFKYFNIANWYTLDTFFNNIKFKTMEDIENFKKNNPCYKNVEVNQQLVLIMN